MNIDQFTVSMQSLGLTGQEIAYLLDLENLRQANGLYANLETLASLIGKAVRPLPPSYELHAFNVANANDDCGSAALIS